MKVASKGFSLLEALVALTILASSSMAIFAWFGSSLQMIRKADLYVQASPVIYSAIDYIKTVDLAEQPTGIYDSGIVRVRWVSRPIHQNVTRDVDNGGSNFFYSLYQVDYIPEVKGVSLPSLTGRVVNYHLKPGANESMLLP